MNTIYELSQKWPSVRPSVSCDAITQMKDELVESQKTDRVITSGPFSCEKSPYEINEYLKEHETYAILFPRQCGACYAFTAIAAIEASALIHLGIRLKLSEQQMVDCSQNFGNHGCIGGNEAQVFDFVINNGGAGNSSVYPYVNQVTQCKRINAAVGIVGYGYVAPGDEDDLKAKVAISPVCANFDARRMKSYTGGIYYDSRCNAEKRTHAVLVVGYGTEDGVDYWLIRNRQGEKLCDSNMRTLF